jgi:hypothetical protein
MYRSRRAAVLCVFVVAAAWLLGDAAPTAAAPTAIEAKDAPAFREALVGVHPRLLYTPDDLREFRTPARRKQLDWIFEAGRSYARSAAGPHPTTGEPWNRGDGWQRWCWWRGVTAAQYYAFTGDDDYADDEIDFLMAICASEHWELGAERDTGMGAANIMGAVAIMYDTYWHKLTPAQRTTVQQRLWLAADRFHHYGWTTKKKLPNAAARYWQADPQNNHRWHRLCGYLLGCLAVYGEVPGIDGYLAHAIEEARFVLKWLPEDGSCHESVAYTSYGASFLIPAFAALHRCVEDTDAFVTHPYIRNAPYWRAHNVLPGGKRVWAWGDGDWSPYYFAHYNFGAIRMSQDATAQALHRQFFAQAPGSYAYHGFTLTHYDPTLEPGDVNDAAPYRFFDDMGMAMWRAGWDDADAAAAMFKCSVYGGERLNAFRDEGATPRYVNVAHDHPDASSFQYAWGGEVFAMEQAVGKAAKMTRQHNTLVVNGRGQAGEATRSDRTTWTQPIDRMGDRADVIEWFGAPGYGVCVGEAGGFYDDLSSFTRTLIFIDGLYIVAIDEVVAAGKPVTLDWFFHCDGEWRDLGGNAWQISKQGKRVRYMVRSAGEVDATRTTGERMTTLQLTGRDRRRAVLAQVLIPLTDADRPPRIDAFDVDGERIYLAVSRPGAVDHVAINGRRRGELTTDAVVAVATVPALEGAEPTLMWVNGRRAAFGKRSVRASRDVNALLAPDGALWTAQPLNQTRAGSARFTGAEPASVNGAKVDPGAVDVPLWRDYLDVGY